MNPSVVRTAITASLVMMTQLPTSVPGVELSVNVDQAYLRLLESAWNGERVGVRGHECRRVRSIQLTFQSTPLVTVRRTAWRQALQEWEWFMSGSTRVSDLPEKVQPWWAPWGDGAGYGRKADILKAGGFSIWHTDNALPPCAYTAFTALEDRGELKVTMMQRSCDLVCGAPHDWIQLWAYSLWLASQRACRLRWVRWMCVDAHVYERHADVVSAILKQKPSTPPELLYQGSGDFKEVDFGLSFPYTPSLSLKAELIV